MSEGFAYGDIIVIAAIAAFIILRYRSILGEKSGFDVTQAPKPKVEQKDQQGERVVQLKPQNTPAENAEPEAIVDKRFEGIESEGLKTDIEAIKKADTSFSVDGFIVGASAAFEMVLEAFNKGDKDTLKMLLSKELYEEFVEALDSRDEEEGKVTLVAIPKAEITEANLDGHMAQVTVTYLSEQIIAPATQLEEVEDEWVFERDTRSKNPNWTIIDT